VCGAEGSRLRVDGRGLRVEPMERVDMERVEG